MSVGLRCVRRGIARARERSRSEPPLGLGDRASVAQQREARKTSDGALVFTAQRSRLEPAP